QPSAAARQRFLQDAWHRPAATRPERPTTANSAPARCAPALRDQVFREDLLDPLERLLCRGLRRRPVLNDLGPGHLPDMLVLDLGISWVAGPERRHGRAEQALPDVSRPVRILRVEPPRAVLHDRR